MQSQRNQREIAKIVATWTLEVGAHVASDIRRRRAEQEAARERWRLPENDRRAPHAAPAH